MKEYRWEKGADYIAIESVKPFDAYEEVYQVESSLPFSELPVEFRD